MSPKTKLNFRGSLHHYLISILIFWIMCFTAHRLIFFLLNAGDIPSADLTLPHIIQMFASGFQLDLSMAAYLTTVAWIVSLLTFFMPKTLAQKLNNGLTAVFVVISSFLAVADALLYAEWKTKIDSMILVHLRRPSEVWIVSSPGQIAGGLALVVAVSSLLIFALYRWQERPDFLKTRFSLNSTFLFFLWPGLLGMTARGGFDSTPISVSRVYFAKEAVLNDAATNTLWFFILDLHNNAKFLSGENPFQSMSEQEAKATLVDLKKVSSASGRSEPSIEILNTPRPNVVFIVLESWSADLVKELGGGDGITPQFSALAQEGLLFTHFYANGNRSQQGMASIFAGFPALPVVTITENPAKVQTLPRFAEQFNRQGYATHFFYGGQLEYGNIRSFLVTNGFDAISEVDQLKGLPRGSLGVPDGEAAPAYARALSQLKPPFLSAFFTLSTHAPYDIPHPELYPSSGREADYLRSARYADQALGAFFQTVKHEPWYQNTLFVLVADHSHASQVARENWEPGYRHIPMLMVGGALKSEFRGRTWDKIGSQVDLTTTLLKQLRWDSSAYAWGQDLFDQSSPAYAYFETNRGVGWVSDGGELVYDREARSTLRNTFPAPEQSLALKRAQAYVQSVVDHYMHAVPPGLGKGLSH